MSGPFELTAREARQLIGAKRLSPVELLESCIAQIERINPAADLSRKGMRQSLGLMVNYLYDLDRIEANHERFVAGEVAASRAVSSML